MSNLSQPISFRELPVAAGAWSRTLGLDYYGTCRPAGDVGRDFFEFIPLDAGKLVVSVGDVAGDDVSAALMNSGLRTFLREFTGSRFAGIARLVEALNRTTCEICPEEFWATLFYAEIDPLRHQLQYVNAGHEPALLVHVEAGRVHRLESTGAVLGLTSRAGYRQRSVKMEPGDVLVVFTDGILEPAEDQERQLRDTNILDIMRSYPHSSAHELVARILDAADRSRQEDDRTVAVVRLLCAVERPLFEAHAAELAFAAA